MFKAEKWFENDKLIKLSKNLKHLCKATLSQFKKSSLSNHASKVNKLILK